jgi:hypothetical protein
LVSQLGLKVTGIVHTLSGTSRSGPHGSLPTAPFRIQPNQFMPLTTSQVSGPTTARHRSHVNIHMKISIKMTVEQYKYFVATSQDASSKIGA